MKQKYLYALGIIILMCNTAFSGIYIVCDDDGSTPTTTKKHVISVVTDANRILRQVASTINITTDGIQYINRSAWKHLNFTDITFPQTLSDMGKLPRGGSLRIIIVDTINGSDLVGFNTRYLTVLAKNANGITFAHEFGHAGGLSDIFPRRDGLSITDAGVVKEEYMPKDWSGYYPPGLLHTNLITRLLMYGYRVPGKGDIPLGRIYGVYAPKDEDGDPLPTTKGMAPVGLQDLNRQPMHRDFDDP